MRFSSRLLLILVVVAGTVGPLWSQSFEVATIKPTPPGDRSGRFMRMQSTRQLVVKSYSLKYLVAAAYDIPPRAISGGPEWIDVDLYDILALTPGDTKPGLDAQLAMLRRLLSDRFSLKFHREPKESSYYELNVVKSGPKLKETAVPESDPVLVNRVFPDRVVLPARNASMSQFASMMQRAVLDRPVVDKTGLAGRYDFDLEWTADETQFDGRLRQVNDSPTRIDLFAALQQQLGLKLDSARGPLDTIVIDSVQRPSEN